MESSTGLALLQLLLVVLVRAASAAQQGWLSHGGPATGGRWTTFPSPILPPNIALSLPSGPWGAGASPLLLPDGSILALGRRQPCGSDCSHGVTFFSQKGLALWSLNTSSPVAGSPAADPRGPFVYVAEQAGVVRALKAMTGETVWVYSTGGSVIQAPLTVVPSGEACCGGILLVGTASGVLHALGLKDGSARWAHQSEAQSSGVSITAAPVASTTGSQVIFGGENGFLHSLETISGREMWKFRTVAAVKGFLAAHPQGGSTFVGDVDGRIHSLTPLGELRWVYDVSWPVELAPAIATASYWGGPVGASEAWRSQLWLNGADAAAHGDMLVFTAGDAVVRALRASDGQLAWKVAEQNGSVLSSPAASSGVVYISVTNAGMSWLSARNATTGNELWRRSLGGGSASSPSLSGGSVVVGTFDAGLVVLCCGRCSAKYRSVDDSRSGESRAVLSLQNSRVGFFSGVNCVVNGVESEAQQTSVDSDYSCPVSEGFGPSATGAALRLVRRCGDSTLAAACEPAVIGGTRFIQDCDLVPWSASPLPLPVADATTTPIPVTTPWPTTPSPQGDGLPFPLWVIAPLAASGILSFVACCIILRSRRRAPLAPPDQATRDQVEALPFLQGPNAIVVTCHQAVGVPRHVYNSQRGGGHGGGAYLRVKYGIASANTASATATSSGEIRWEEMLRLSLNGHGAAKLMVECWAAITDGSDVLLGSAWVPIFTEDGLRGKTDQPRGAEEDWQEDKLPVTKWVQLTYKGADGEGRSQAGTPRTKGHEGAYFGMSSPARGRTGSFFGATPGGTPMPLSTPGGTPMPGAGMVRLTIAEAPGPDETPMDLDAVERELYGGPAASPWQDEHASVMSELNLQGASSQGWGTRPSHPSGGYAGGSVPLGHRTPSSASVSSSTGGFGPTASSAQHMRQMATVQAFRARSRASGHEDVSELLSPSRAGSRAASQGPSRATSRATAAMPITFGLPLGAVPEEASFKSASAAANAAAAAAAAAVLSEFPSTHDAASHNPPPLAAAAPSRVPVAGRRSRAGAYASAANSSSAATNTQLPTVDPILPLLLARSASKNHYHNGHPPQEQQQGAILVHGAAPPPPPAGGQITNRGRASSRISSNQPDAAPYAPSINQRNPPLQAPSALSSAASLHGAPSHVAHGGAREVAGRGGGSRLTGARDDLRPIAPSSGASNGPVRWTHGGGDDGGGGKRPAEQSAGPRGGEATGGDFSNGVGSDRSFESLPDEAGGRGSRAGRWRSAKPGQIDTGMPVSSPLDDLLGELHLPDGARY